LNKTLWIDRGQTANAADTGDYSDGPQA